MRTKPGIMIFAFTALFVFFSAPTPSLAAKPIASLPYFTDYYGWLTVKVQINGEGPYDFIIDTGATNSLVFQNLADIHDFQPSGNPPQTVLGLTTQGAFPTYVIGEMALGEARLENLSSVILPDWSVEQKPQGIIGLDFLTRYILVFNADGAGASGRLDIYDPQAGPNPADMRGWKRIRLEQRDFGVDVEHDLFTAVGRVNVNPKRIRFMIDLGASGTVINWASVREEAGGGLRLNQALPSRLRRSRITGALDQDASRAQAVIVSKLRIGRQNWRRQVVTLHDAPIFTELGMQDTPFGLFGADLVRDRSFMLNLPGNEIRLGEAPRS